MLTRLCHYASTANTPTGYAVYYLINKLMDLERKTEESCGRRYSRTEAAMKLRRCFTLVANMALR